MTNTFRLFAIFLTSILVSCSDRSPLAVFNAVLDEEKMKSAKVVNSEDQSFGECCIWLHFTVDSIELVDELKNCKESFVMCDTTEYEAKWWNPKRMGNNIKCYQRNHDRIWETFFVNQSMTEVYYQNFSQ